MIAELSISRKRAHKPPDMAKCAPSAAVAAVAPAHELAGKLRFAPRAAIRRFERAALRQSYRFSASRGGTSPGKVKGCFKGLAAPLTDLAPHPIRAIRGNPPGRVYPRPRSLGEIAIRGFLDCGALEQPILVAGSADDLVCQIARTANSTCVPRNICRSSRQRRIPSTSCRPKGNSARG